MSAWQPIETAPEFERVLVAGWQKCVGRVPGWWWWYEDVVIGGRGSDHPEATHWAPIVLPDFPAPPQ